MLRFCALFVLLAAGVMLASGVSQATGPKGPVQVIDGDTLDVGGVRVRLHAIDAPELDQVCLAGSREVPCGRWVRDAVKVRYAGRVASCTALDTDRYGRTVARCTVDGQDIGGMLVSDGLAFAYLKYGRDYAPHQARAAANARGLHAMQVQSPEQFRRERTATAEAPDGCPIKGNISDNGRIYHKPGQAFYDRTRIDPARGERWFCSEAEAQAAGWRAARG